MKIQIQIIIEHEELEEPLVEEVGCLVREELLPETLGMTLEEGKDILASIQQQMITHQAKWFVTAHSLHIYVNYVQASSDST